MEVAKIVREDFLQQNIFSEYDYASPLPKSVGMMRVIVQVITHRHTTHTHTHTHTQRERERETDAHTLV